MENFSNYSSYPDSRDSSPRSREIIDCDAASWDDQSAGAAAQQGAPQAYKAKFMCSYGGKIQPRPHDNQLAYVGGDTKILSVDRAIKLNAFLSKLSSIAAGSGGAGDSVEVCFKYQLPGEDLDALISVTNDEDLDHMMMEYDRLHRSSPSKPARLRLFLFPVNPTSAASSVSGAAHSVSGAEKSDRQWFVDALNSVQIQSLEGSSPPAAAAVSAQSPDFLFGFDKGYPAGKFVDSVPPPMIPDSILAAKDVTAGSDCGSEDRHGVGEIPPPVSPAEIQRQIQELQRLHIASQEQAMMQHHQHQQQQHQQHQQQQQQQQQQQRKYEDMGNPRAFAASGGEYYSQQPKFSEKLAPAPSQMPVQVPMQIPATYVSERHVTAGGYHVAAPQGAAEQQVYLIQTPSGGVYHQAAAAPPPPQQMRPVTGPVGQPYYGVHQRMVPEVYREQQMYNAAPTQMLSGEQGMPPMMQQQPPPQPRPQVGYDSAGRQVYYTTTTTYQNVAPVAVDGRQGGGMGSGGSASGGGGIGGGGSSGALSQDGKVVVPKA